MLAIFKTTEIRGCVMPHVLYVINTNVPRHQGMVMLH